MQAVESPEIADDETSSSPYESDSPLIAAGNEMKGRRFCSKIKEGTVDELLCEGYKRDVGKWILVVIGTVCTSGFLQLIFYWRPDWRLKCTHRRANWKETTSVSLTLLDTKQIFVSIINYMSLEQAYHMYWRYPKFHTNHREELEDGSYGTKESKDVKYFVHHDATYIWRPKERTFVELPTLDGLARLEHIHQDATAGLSVKEVEKRRTLFGENVITVEVPSYPALLLSEVLNPFYVFQLFAVIFWCIDEYYIYGVAIFIISAISAVVSLIQVRSEREKLHDMVEYHNETKTTALRQVETDSEETELWARELVPGDVIVIPPGGIQLSCDAALVSGTCIVNESMLTGESVPVTKTPLPSSESEMCEIYSADLHKRHTLFCGTQVVQTRFYSGELVKAVVVRTGYHTSKGQLVHSILYPKPVDMKLLRDAYRFIGVLFAIAMLGFIYTVVIQSSMGESTRDILFNAIDLITISVPPALPLALTIGIVYAQRRLKQHKIHCISPQRINTCGQVDVVAFDKTGTLTEDGLDLACIIPVEHVQAHAAANCHVSFSTQVEPEQLPKGISEDVINCMASCHTLTTIDGNLTGDPLDMKLFEAAGWELIEPSVEDAAKYDNLQMTYVRPARQNSDAEDEDILSQDVIEAQSRDLGIVRQFPFASSLQRASVIVKRQDAEPRDMLVYVKGAPETVARLCDPSTVPAEFQHTLQIYSRQGFRMIGMAYKPLNIAWPKAQKIERSAVECDLRFLGMFALQNKLKPQSAGALEKLHRANIRSLMVTGDNILTSLSVARESGMIKPRDEVLLAITAPPSEGNSATLTWHLFDSARTSSVGSSASSDSTPVVSIKKTNSNKCIDDVIINFDETPRTWHLAVSGPDMANIKEFFPNWVNILAAKGAVFARMSPQQKTDLMEDLQNIDYHVCMCGDGANDCGALKRAHAGLSLSEHEASVAAPFTSHTDVGIECVPTLIREGRAALVTSFGMFKFMALYSVIQFCSITLLYNRLSSLSDLEFLYIDLIIIDVVALTMSLNHAHKHLHRLKPPNSLMALEILTSLIFQLLLQLGTQLILFLLVGEQCWYTHLSPNQINESIIANTTNCPPLAHVPDQSSVEDDMHVMTYETSSIFFLSAFLYLSVSVAFSRGKPFRTALYENYAFVVSLLVLAGMTAFLMFGAPVALANFMMIRVIPDMDFLFLLLAIAAGHFVVSVGFELLIIEQSGIWSALRRTRAFQNARRRPAKRYKTLIRELTCDESGRDVSNGSDVHRQRLPIPEHGKIFTSETPINICTKTHL